MITLGAHFYNSLFQTETTKIYTIYYHIFAIGLNFNYFKTSEYLGRGDDYYINRYIPVPIASSEYLKTSEEYLRLPKETEKGLTKIIRERMQLIS